MKKILLLSAVVAVAAIVVTLTAFRTPTKVTCSKHVITETRSLDNFTEIEVGGAFQIDVTYSSNEEKVEVEAPENIQNYIITKVKSGKLMISFRSSTNITCEEGVKIHITTAKLNDFELSGAASISLNNLMKDSNLDVESSGAASFKGEIAVSNANIELSGAASMNLFGFATSADIELSGASQLNDYDFTIDNLTINLSGASHASLSSAKSIKADASGASSFNYKGNPSINDVHRSGAASIQKL
jgi:hypothetical protein